VVSTAPEPESTLKRPRGGQRDEGRRRAVLQATRELLAESGYGAFSISDVATRAGVGRQLVYRGWTTKLDLVGEALCRDTATLWPTEYPGPFREDLRSFVTALVDWTNRPYVRIGIAGLIGDARDRAEPLSVVVEHFDVPLRRSFAQLILEGQRREETHAGIDVSMSLESIRGATLFHSFNRTAGRQAMIDHITAFAAASLEIH
jgi:AcrR family transcriptional regulator